MKSIKFITLGCKVNQYDTQSIRERFLKRGYKEIYNGMPADICLINTCTVTAVADRKSMNEIRNCIRENPRAKIIVTGCIVEKGALTLAEIRGVDFVISKKFFPAGISDFCGHTRAFLKIQDGCDNFCSYCKVPLARGRSRSRDLGEIISEAQQLVKNGFREIVLCGICLGSYGKDTISPHLYPLPLRGRGKDEGEKDLLDVIEALEKIEGLLRIRLSSIEAGDVSDALIQKMAQSKKLCRHLHIPMQSGDDEILKKMNRNYRREDYLNLIKKIKSSIPGIAITTDVLVGFPGEKEDNFQNTVDLIREIMPLRSHIFPYSKRSGTRASNFEDKVNPLIIKERISELTRISKTCAFDYKKQFLSKDKDVLVEERSKENNKYWQGYTDNYIKTRVKSGKDLRNQLIHVRLKKINKDCIEANLL